MGGIIIRIIKVVGVLGGIVVIAVVIAIALVFVGDPTPCVSRSSVASAAAVQAAQAKWDGFKAAGGGAAVQFNEQEVTSRGVAYIQERDVPIRGLQVYFCPDGKAEAKGQVRVLGRDVNVLIRGWLDVSGGRNVVMIDSVKAGSLPSFVGTSIVNQVIDRNNVRQLPLGIVLVSSTNGDGAATLKR